MDHKLSSQPITIMQLFDDFLQKKQTNKQNSTLTSKFRKPFLQHNSNNFHGLLHEIVKNFRQLQPYLQKQITKIDFVSGFNQKISFRFARF
jgi:primosomal protein N''